MAYATVEELAYELNTRLPLPPDKEAAYQKCLDAAALEIDHYIDGDVVWPEADALLNRVNVLRGVEWVKASEAAWGVLGTSETGALQAPKDTFARHGRTLVPLKQQWGVA